MILDFCSAGGRCARSLEAHQVSQNYTLRRVLQWLYSEVIPQEHSSLRSALPPQSFPSEAFTAPCQLSDLFGVNEPERPGQGCLHVRSREPKRQPACRGNLCETLLESLLHEERKNYSKSCSTDFVVVREGPPANKR
jgi:hypothetical protein